MALKNLHVTNDSAEAEVIKIQLAEVGIEAFLKDAMVAQVTGVPLEVGGIKVQVREKDLQKGMEKLIELGYVNKEDLAPERKPFLSKSQASLFSKLLIYAIAVAIVSFLLLYFDK